MLYPESEACRFLTLHDISELGGSVMWAKQIENKLDEHLKRIEVLLGSDWERHQEGRKLKVRGGWVRDA